MPNPSISVIMPVYNVQDYLGKAIESVLNQTFTDFELIAIDDGSNDESLNILKSFARKDKRVRVIKNQENRGLPKTLNRGLDLAMGEFIARMDGDDICEPSRFQKQFDRMSKESDLVLCGTWIKFFGEKDYVKKMPSLHNELVVKMFLEFPFEHPTLMFRREALDNFNIKYDEGLKLAEDLDICTRLAARGKVTNIEEPLLRLRHHHNRTHRVQKDILYHGLRRVMKRQLMELGLSCQEEDIRIMMDVRANKIVSDRREMKKRTIWYERLVRANEIKRIYPRYEFKKYIIKHWEDLLRGSASEVSFIGFYLFSSSFGKEIKKSIFSRLLLANRLNHQ
ncbi:MAG: glycosyltransferase family 2 protein [Bacteroidota bacterium]